MQRMVFGLLGLVAVGIAGVVVLCAVLYFGQDRTIFYPHANDPQWVQGLQANRVEIVTPGATLEGWWVENPAATTPATILYFGGNAEDVLHMAVKVSNLDAQRLLVVNYRGYGHSTGKPGQAALYEDALAIYEHAIGRGIRPEHIVPMGRSLGSGVASMLAGSRRVGAVVLVTPFDSLAAVGTQHYPFLPVRWLLRHPFPSTEWARRAQAPALFLAAEHDFVVPAVHAQRLFEVWPAKKQIHVLAATGHNDIDLHPDYYRLINEFLRAEMSAHARNL